MRIVPGVALSAALVVALAGCGREAAFADRTARVTVDGDTTTYEVDSCGLDGQTVFVVGRSEEGRTVQAVVGVEGDGETGVPRSSGLTVVGDGVSVGAFGVEAWARRGEEGPPPGTIASARVRGARIQFRGQAEPVDAEDRPTGDDPVGFAFDARCDQRDGE